ncbi:MAG: hypothetical protein IJ457_08020 [Clostridia bacterium]|nr:hypothetical protein [Clostridia bacterium]
MDPPSSPLIGSIFAILKPSENTEKRITLSHSLNTGISTISEQIIPVKLPAAHIIHSDSGESESWEYFILIPSGDALTDNTLAPRSFAAVR